MKYKIISTSEIDVADEEALEILLGQINVFVEGKNGTTKHLIRTNQDTE